MRKLLLATVAMLAVSSAYAGPSVFESRCQIEGDTVVMTLNVATHTATATKMIPGFVDHPRPSLFAYKAGEGTLILDTLGKWFIADPESGKTSFLPAFGGVEAMTCTTFHEVTY